MENSHSSLALSFDNGISTQSGKFIASSVGISGGYAEGCYAYNGTFNYHVEPDRYMQLKHYLPPCREIKVVYNSL